MNKGISFILIHSYIYLKLMYIFCYLLILVKKKSLTLKHNKLLLPQDSKQVALTFYLQLLKIKQQFKPH